jgi:hypothetical protein
MIMDLKPHRHPGWLNRLTPCPFLASFATCTVAFLTRQDLFVIQLGGSTSARHVLPITCKSYDIKVGRDSYFSIDPRATCTPGVLRLPVTENRISLRDAPGMLFIGSKDFWKWSYLKEIGVTAERFNLTGSDNMRRLTHAAMGRYSQAIFRRPSGTSMACVSLWLCHT